MRLSKRKALELTAELWDWISENGKEKGEWPGWAKQNAWGDCFLCEYDDQHSGTPLCKKCPLYGKWNGHKCCDTMGSPYNTWEEKDKASPEARQAAKRIADLCREELVRIAPTQKSQDA